MRYKFLRFPGGKAKALTLSYDDGCVQDKKLIAIADKYGIKVTLNINGSLMSPSMSRLTAGELKELIKNGGHEIANHGARHIANGLVSVADGISEVLDCRRKLESDFDTIIRGMAYPDSGIRRINSGITKDDVKGYLKGLGIAYARSTGSDNDSFELPADLYDWMPTVRHSNPMLMEYLDKFLKEGISTYPSARASKLFYLWGHSFEFDNDNNWDLFESFCKTAGGRDDIFYATNIEIADYINAYNALIFNLENTKVYNPTDKQIWFEATDMPDGHKTVCIQPGERLLLD